MRRVLPVALVLNVLMLLATPLAMRTQTVPDAASDTSQKNARQARAALDAMVQALGGQAWLNVKNQMPPSFMASPRAAPLNTGSTTPGPIATASSTANTAMWCSFTWDARAPK